MAVQADTRDVVAPEVREGRGFVLEDALVTLGIAADDTALIGAAVQRLMRLERQAAAEAFVRLRWLGHTGRLPLAEVAARLLGSSS